MKNKFLNTMILHFVVVLSVFSFISCSSDDDSRSSSKTHFSPPTWIQGKWGYYYGDNTYSFKFTSNNFYMNNGGDIDYNELVNVGGLSVEEQKTTDKYKIIISGGSVNTTLVFRKINENMIIQEHAGVDLELYKK